MTPPNFAQMQDQDMRRQARIDAIRSLGGGNPSLATAPQPGALPPGLSGREELPPGLARMDQLPQGLQNYGQHPQEQPEMEQGQAPQSQQQQPAVQVPQQSMQAAQPRTFRPMPTQAQGMPQRPMNRWNMADGNAMQRFNRMNPVRRPIY